MQKESEQDYIISGNTVFCYDLFYYFPYFDYFRAYEAPGANRYVLPISTCVRFFLRSINKHDKRFSIRINRISIIHTQLGDNPVIRSSIVGDTYMFNLPQSSFDLGLGVPHNVDTTASVYENHHDYMFSLKHWEQPFFQYFSPDGRMDWDFRKGTYPPGYGSFVKYDQNDFPIAGAIIPKGWYLAYIQWMYRMVKILIDVTIRDEY